ncbi:MAG TPA: TIGR03620 family F420-dependent LLM class oxidoreductase [Kineosporiaceae bacterium]|nr:TIGR03620 family F420-dependent LLM class oxidoreductase [Kineosporiaceae bacterium]
MSPLQLGPIAVALNVSADGTHLAQAAELERLGYAAIWLPGGQIDTLDRISEVVGATKAIPVASGIISPDVYPATAVLQCYANLQQDAPDRFVVGLGASQKPPALPALHAYLDELDAAPEPVPADRRILAAMGPRKLAVARERCAGAITLLVTPTSTAAARQELGPDRSLVVDQFVVLDTEPARARETARQPLRFLSQIGGYRASFARMGFTEQDVETLSDHLVDELVFWGDVDSVAARVREHLQAGANQVVLSVLGGAGVPDQLQAETRLAERLLP